MILGSKLGAQVRERFRGTNEQISVGSQLASQAVKQFFLCFSVEVDRDVAAKDNIELSQIGEWFEQISSLKGDKVAELVLDPPAVFPFDEILF